VVDLQGVSFFIPRLWPVILAPKYARICGDVIRVGNFWREVPEIAEPGSNGRPLECIRLLDRSGRQALVSDRTLLATDQLVEALDGQQDCARRIPGGQDELVDLAALKASEFLWQRSCCLLGRDDLIEANSKFHVSSWDGGCLGS
jgi:hypothetical protein